MQSGKLPKVRVHKIALEIIQAGHQATVVKDVDLSGMTRDYLVEVVEQHVQADRLRLTDTQFRQLYVNYIRNYWGKGSPGDFNHG